MKPLIGIDLLYIFSNIAISNLMIAGPLYVGYFLLTDMQNIVINNINLIHSSIISLIPLYFTLNNGNYHILFRKQIIGNLQQYYHKKYICQFTIIIRIITVWIIIYLIIIYLK